MPSSLFTDWGVSDPFRGWYDVSGCGVCNDYCRWVGNSGSGGDPRHRQVFSSSFWSCVNQTAHHPRPPGDRTSWPWPKCSRQGVPAPYRPPTPPPSRAGQPAVAAGSCADVLAAYPLAASGVHTVVLGNMSTSVYCDMSTFSGGWTMVYANNGYNFANEAASFSRTLPVTPSSARAKFASATVNLMTRRAAEPTVQYELWLQGRSGSYVSNTLMRSTEPFYLAMNTGQVTVAYDCDKDGTYERSRVWNSWTDDRAIDPTHNSGTERASWIRDWVFRSGETGECYVSGGSWAGNVLQWWNGNRVTAGRPIVQTAQAYAHSGIMALYVRPRPRSRPAGTQPSTPQGMYVPHP